MHSVETGSTKSDRIRDLERLVAAKRQALAAHTVFGQIRGMAELRTFMTWHVFAVWDFMSLVKRLQNDLTCTRTPWTPPASARAARLMNEIVLGEETDEAPGGGHLSHYELYLAAMGEVGARTELISSVVRRVQAGAGTNEALELESVDPAVRRFVQHTMSVSAEAPLIAVLGNFFFSREDMIPEMFKSLLEQWGVEPSSVPMFVYYLQRHIELDGDTHGPAAQAIIDELLGDDENGRVLMLQAAASAIDERFALWDALSAQLHRAFQADAVA
jgi:hypothetical protein